MNKRGKNKIKVDYGMGDFYKHYASTVENPVDKHTYRKIIADFHEGLQNLIVHKGLIYQFPHTRFELMLKKKKVKPQIRNGKLVNNLPVNWKATNELWENNPEAKQKKLLIRETNPHTKGFVFSVYFKKFKSNLKFRSVYKFKIVRQFARYVNNELKKEDNNIDAYLLY